MIGDANFTILEVPYFNALTAGEFDASSSFQANDPASHIVYSLQTLGLYQTPGQTVRSDVIVWGNPPTNAQPAPKCGTFEIGCQLQQFIGSDVVKDYSKRVGLVLVAVLLIVVAIISLR